MPRTPFELHDFQPDGMHHFVKHWSFDTCAIAGLAFSSLAVLLLIVNAVASIVPVAVLIPVAAVLLLIGGAFSVRAHFLRYNQNKAASKKLR